VSAGSELACKNCGVGHGPDDIFCENCGYDFITGSMPGPDEQFPLSSAPPDSNTAEDRFGGALFPGPPPSASSTPFGMQAPAAQQGAPVSVQVEVSADRAYFEAVVSEGELDFPDPPPPPVDLELTGPELHVGRTSQSRAIHPDIDVAALTGDPAVSSRHAVIRGGADGTITVTDVGSTNGTYVGAFNGSGIGVGQPVKVPAGGDVFVGAWTRLRITTVSSPPAPPTPPTAAQTGPTPPTPAS
jgi:hypothetical protein